MTLGRRRLVVILVTVSRLPLAAAAAGFLLVAGPGSTKAWAALGLLLAAEITDLLDGGLARRLGVAGRFGALFDPYCDSITRLIAYFGLASAGLCAWWLLLLMAVRDVSVAYIRIMSIISGRAVAARLSGKMKALVQGLGGLTLASTLAIARLVSSDLHVLRLAVGWAVAAVTVWSLVDYFVAAVAPKKPPRRTYDADGEAQTLRNA
ncbi:MAG: CDP-alcohol phosphatidyltransferase family protein [Planctomycetota bacterium]